MYAAREVNKERYDVTVVSPRNHFLFTPLLPSTTVGTLEFRYSSIFSIKPVSRSRLLSRTKTFHVRICVYTGHGYLIELVVHEK